MESWYPQGTRANTPPLRRSSRRKQVLAWKEGKDGEQEERWRSARGRWPVHVAVAMAVVSRACVRVAAHGGHLLMRGRSIAVGGCLSRSASCAHCTAYPNEAKRVAALCTESIG